MTKTSISKSTAKQLIRLSRELIKSGELEPSWTSNDPDTHVLSERCFVVVVPSQSIFGYALADDKYFLIDDYNVPDSEEVKL